MVELVLGIRNFFRVSIMSQTLHRGFIHLLLLTSVGIRERLDFTKIYIILYMWSKIHILL